MSKNLIPQIAKMLGVELGEEFKIKGEDELMTYRFSSDGLQVTYGDGIEIPYISTNSALVALVKGEEEIIKKRWRPKLIQPYWCIQENCVSCAPELSVCFVHEWQGTFYELLLLKAGLVFKTEKEARAALPLAAEEIGWGYEL